MNARITSWKAGVLMAVAQAGGASGGREACFVEQFDEAFLRDFLLEVGLEVCCLDAEITIN